MKRAITKTRTIIAAAVILLSLHLTPAAHAGDTVPAENKSLLEFKLLSKFNNGPLFQLKTNNAETDEFIIRVKDADGYVLFTENLSGVNISRKYQLSFDKEELYEAFNVRFEITSVKTKETFVFNAANKSRTVTDIIIAKL